MSAYLGPNAEQTDYEGILEKFKDDVEQRIASFNGTDRQPPTELLYLDFLTGSLLSLVGGGSAGGGGGGLSQTQVQGAITDALGGAGLDLNNDNGSALGDTLTLILGALNTLKNRVATIPGMQRVTASGTLSAGFSKVSIANTGSSNGTVIGAVLKPFETVDFGDRQDSLAAIAFDATGTEFLITTESQP